MEDKEVYEMLSLARTRLILDHTFFGMMALRLNWVEKHDIPTAAVDGKNMFYNPNFIRTLPPPQKETLLAHEAMHPMLDHIGRRAGRQLSPFPVPGAASAAVGLYTPRPCPPRSPSPSSPASSAPARRPSCAGC